MCEPESMEYVLVCTGAQHTAKTCHGRYYLLSFRRIEFFWIMLYAGAGWGLDRSGSSPLCSRFMCCKHHTYNHSSGSDLSLSLKHKCKCFGRKHQIGHPRFFMQKVYISGFVIRCTVNITFIPVPIITHHEHIKQYTPVFPRVGLCPLLWLPFRHSLQNDGPVLDKKCHNSFLISNSF